MLVIIEINEILSRVYCFLGHQSSCGCGVVMVSYLPLWLAEFLIRIKVTAHIWHHIRIVILW